MLDVYYIPLPVRVRSRVIDIWLHSSPTLSAPTDSQYLLLSAEREPPKEKSYWGVVGWHLLPNSIPFFSPHFFLFLLILFSISINTWATRKDSIRNKERLEEEVMHLSSETCCCDRPVHITMPFAASVTHSPLYTHTALTCRRTLYT